MTDVARMRQLQEEIARSLLNICRSLGIPAIEMSATSFDGSTSVNTWNPAVDGPTGSVRSPSDLFDPLEELREVCSNPGKGTWLSVRVLVQAGGQFQFYFNYDMRPYTYSRERDLLTPPPGDPTPDPDDFTLLEDLKHFPRDADALPDWYPRPAGIDAPVADLSAPVADLSAPVADLSAPVGGHAAPGDTNATVSESRSATFGSEVRIQELEDGIARTLRRVGMTTDLRRLVFTFAGLNGTGTATIYDPESVDKGPQLGFGNRTYQRFDAAQLPMEPLLELRHLKAEPGRGTWFSVVVRVGVDPAGSPINEFIYNYHRRIYYNSPSPEMDVPPANSAADPTNQEYLDDLRRYPRDAALLPAWYPRLPTTSAMQVPVVEGAGSVSTAAERAIRSREASLFPSDLSVLMGSSSWVLMARAIKVHTTQVLTADVPAWEHDGDNHWVSTTIFDLVYDEKIASATGRGVKSLWREARSLFQERSLESVPDGELVSEPSEELESLLEDVCDVIGDLINHRLAAAAGV